MRLAADERRKAISAYHENGWYAANGKLDEGALKKVRKSVDVISRMVRPEVVKEDGADVVRALHGCHRYDEVCAQLVRVPLLLDFAHALVGEEVYVYQFKVNIKSPREGKEWPWHQDFSFWSREDGMLRADAVNIAINLDDVHEYNGPLTVLSGSHKTGLVDAADDVEAVTGSDWRKHVSAQLTYTVPDERVETLARQHGTETLLGPAGTITVFHPSIVHSSSNNLSDDRRTILLITYNSVKNAPAWPSRPEFLVSRDTTALQPLEGALS